MTETYRADAVAEAESIDDFRARARAWLADGVGVEQEPSHHLGVISRFSATIGPFIVVNNRAQIQFADKVGDEAGQMTFWQPVLQVGRE